MLDSGIWTDSESIYSENSSYSDEIDSDIEVELYSAIHHQESCISVPESVDNNSLERKDIINCEIVTPKETVETENFYFSDGCENHIYYTSFESPVKAKPKESKGFLEANISTKPTSIHLNNSSAVLKYSKNFMNTKTVDDMIKTSKIVGRKHMIEKKVTEVINEKDQPAESDSDDSVIWLDTVKTSVRDLKTNLLIYNSTIPENLNFVDNFFTSDHIPYQPRRNLSLPNLVMGEKSKDDMWHVDDEDIYIKKCKKVPRFYHRMSVSCTICGKIGHSEAFCCFKGNKCYICGGLHLFYKCKNRICSKCFRTGHEKKSCWLHFTASCKLCHMRGHHSNTCPDIWRRYHLTTDSAQIVPGRKIKQTTPLYCFNCGQKGHFGASCQEQRNSLNENPTWPLVISYSIPKESDVSMKENKVKNNWTNLKRKINKNENTQGEQNKRRKCSPEKSNGHMSVSKAKIKSKKQYFQAILKRKKWQKMKELKRNETDFPRSPRNVERKEECVVDMQALEVIQKQFKRKRKTKRYYRMLQKLITE